MDKVDEARRAERKSADEMERRFRKQIADMEGRINAEKDAARAGIADEFHRLQDRVKDLEADLQAARSQLERKDREHAVELEEAQLSYNSKIEKAQLAGRAQLEDTERRLHEALLKAAQQVDEHIHTGRKEAKRHLRDVQKVTAAKAMDQKEMEKMRQRLENVEKAHSEKAEEVSRKQARIAELSQECMTLQGEVEVLKRKNAEAQQAARASPSPTPAAPPCPKCPDYSLQIERLQTAYNRIRMEYNKEREKKKDTGEKADADAVAAENSRLLQQISDLQRKESGLISASELNSRLEALQSQLMTQQAREIERSAESHRAELDNLKAQHDAQIRDLNQRLGQQKGTTPAPAPANPDVAMLVRTNDSLKRQVQQQEQQLQAQQSQMQQLQQNQQQKTPAGGRAAGRDDAGFLRNRIKQLEDQVKSLKEQIAQGDQAIRDWGKEKANEILGLRSQLDQYTSQDQEIEQLRNRVRALEAGEAPRQPQDLRADLRHARSPTDLSDVSSDANFGGATIPATVQPAQLHRAHQQSTRFPAHAPRHFPPPNR
eukprot:NODE_462_length_2069_cov_22.290099_g367_i0.p1 GENE.NODE_462_length_2069_cov_22.290099_g367_i0~~NODE_462_length_2069_cov_22.290099_g367_i0.p1  ORF type:complete len:626 (+),score=209.91 NODE_462_length_2069_cov_22.290099_g367_i0:244-1878(+)